MVHQQFANLQQILFATKHENFCSYLFSSNCKLSNLLKSNIFIAGCRKGSLDQHYFTLTFGGSTSNLIFSSSTTYYYQIYTTCKLYLIVRNIRPAISHIFHWLSKKIILIGTFSRQNKVWCYNGHVGIWI